MWQWELNWRRPILERELNIVEELLNLVSNYPLVGGTPDSWVWTKEEGSIFSVKSTYLILQGVIMQPQEKVFQKLWAIKAPSNVLSIAWRVLLNWVQSKDNLF